MKKLILCLTMLSVIGVVFAKDNERSRRSINANSYHIVEGDTIIVASKKPQENRMRFFGGASADGLFLLNMDSGNPLGGGFSLALGAIDMKYKFRHSLDIGVSFYNRRDNALFDTNDIYTDYFNPQVNKNVFMTMWRAGYGFDYIGIDFGNLKGILGINTGVAGTTIKNINAIGWSFGIKGGVLYNFTDNLQLEAGVRLNTSIVISFDAMYDIVPTNAGIYIGVNFMTNPK